jgi:hypothetical protein
MCYELRKAAIICRGVFSGKVATGRKMSNRVSINS